MACYKILNFSSHSFIFSPNTPTHKDTIISISIFKRKKEKKETMSSKEEEREENDLMAQFMAGDSSVCT